MATIFILLGSVLGFLAGLVLYFGFDSGLTVALLVWGASGPLSAIIVIALSFDRHPSQSDPSDGTLAEIA